MSINVSLQFFEHKVEVQYIAMQRLLKVADPMSREIIPEEVVRSFLTVNCKFRFSVIYFAIQAMKI